MLDQQSEAMSGRSFGHYQILDLLGKGGMGEVYRARDTRLAREVAIKFLPQDVARDETKLRRLEREARMLASLNHPNIATIHGLEYFDERRLIVMELLPGESLDRLIGRGPIPVEQALSIFRQIAEALEAAHAKGVIHRDLKPANIIVSPQGKVKLLDFGLAKALDIGPESGAIDAEPLASLTGSGVVLGTPVYMSPEQVRGEAADKSTDIWAFGCVLYEALTGLRAFRGKNVPEILSSVLRDEPDWNNLPSQTPRSLRGLMQQCCNKKKGERLHDMSAARIGIDECLSDLQQPSRLTSLSLIGNRAARRYGRRALTYASVALIALVGVLLVVRGLIGGGSNEPKPSEPVTLAVLPLQVLTAKEQIGYLGVGISDAIITRLANIAQLRVRPTSSILRYKDEPPDVQEVAKTLNAENVLSGTLQQVGSRLRISVQLIRTVDATPLWGQHYDLAQQDLLLLQDQLAEKVTTALKIRATAAERERVYRRYTQNAEAYDQYLRGRAQISVGDSARTAVEAFERALKVDPNYALAHAGLAYASGVMYNSVAVDAQRKEWGERAEREARAALEIDPELAEAHDALAAYYQYTEFNWDRTIEESRRALELNPALDRPHFALAGTYLHTGLLDLVESEARAAIELNPGGGLTNVAILTGVAALWGGRFNEAEPLLEQGRREVGPSALVDWNLATAYFYIGKQQQAEQLAASIYRGEEPDIRAQAALTSFLAARGERTRAKELAKQVAARPSFEHHAMYSIAGAYAQLGEPAEAVRLLRLARDTGFFCYPFYSRDPLLRPLSRDPQFQAFMEEFRKSWEAFRARYSAGPS